MSRLLSIVIPAYNEERRIGPTLKELNATLKGQEREIIVVADGQDDTAGAVRKTRVPDIKILPHRNRLGKGGAIKAGIAAASGDAIVIYDADGAMPASELYKLLFELKSHDVVIGSRYSKESHAKLSKIRKITAWCFNRWIRVLFGLPFSDTQCGFKAFHGGVAKKLAARTKQTGFVWDVEMLYLARKQGLAVTEVPIKWQEKDGGDLAKNTLKNALKIFADSIKLRLSV